MVVDSCKKRRIASSISELADSIPVIVVTGARQVGKSTMLRNEFADYDYITLDDYAVLEQTKTDPQSLWMGRDKVIILKKAFTAEYAEERRVKSKT